MILLRFISDRWAPVSIAIRLATRSWASHVELVKVELYPGTGDPLDLKNCVIPVPVVNRELWRIVDVLGCRFPRGIQHYPYRTNGVTREEWYTAPNLPLVWQWMDAHVGDRYDLLTIFGVATSANWHDGNRDICSESVLRGSEWASLQPGAESPDPWLNALDAPWRITPRDLLLSNAIEHFRKIR